MITIRELREFGADVEDGLARCMNNEAFYLKMVNMGLADERFEQLGIVLQAHDLKEAFEITHALKGVLGNLALVPMYELVSEMTEHLRAEEDADYMGLYEDILEKRKKLLSKG